MRSKTFCEILLILCFGLPSFFNGQVHTVYPKLELLLEDIHPASEVKDWNVEYVSAGTSNETNSSGFKRNANGDKYIIRYQKNSNKGKSSFLKADNENLMRDFLGKIDSPAEAFLILAAKGFYYDEEVAHFGGAWEEKGNVYHLSVSKIISEKCPLAKAYYNVEVEKFSGKILSIKDGGTYHRIFDKSCENDPSNPKIIPTYKTKKKTGFYF